MKALRKRQQAVFYRWLQTNGHPNIDVFTGENLGPYVKPAIQANGDSDDFQTQYQTSDQSDEYDEDATEEEDGKDARNNARPSTEADLERRRQSDEFDDIEDLIENARDESGLDILPKHRNDTHTIVREDSTLDKDQSRKVLCTNAGT